MFREFFCYFVVILVVSLSCASGSAACPSNPALISTNSGLNSVNFFKANSKAIKYSSEFVPAGNGILQTLLNLPFLSQNLCRDNKDMVRERKNIFIIIKNILCAVTMMNIIIIIATRLYLYLLIK